MSLMLYNTLSRQKEAFQPMDSARVRMYACGPTVYDRAHIGNARAVVVYDMLFRLLQAHYGPEQVVYVRNITDVDDKINAAAKQNGETIQSLTRRVTGWFHDDMAALHALPPSHEPRATEHIAGMHAIIQRLIDHGRAYVVASGPGAGHVLFDVSQDPHYGHLSGRTTEDMQAGARIAVEPWKKNPGDFVLWKPTPEGDDPSSIFSSPWGLGRPGWHIECSAMSHHFLGEDFDIHGGGADLKFPHHENEIAQSCGAFPGSHFARTWVHNGFVTVNGEKMSKSLGNFITVHELLEQGVKGEVIRLVFLTTHYRKPLDWNQKALDDAKATLDGWYRIKAEHGPTLPAPALTPAMQEALDDDMNLPLMLAEAHRLAKLARQGDKEAVANLLAGLHWLGLMHESAEAWLGLDAAPAEIIALAEARQKAKAERAFEEADRLRAAIEQAGWVLEDVRGGTYRLRRG